MIAAAVPKLKDAKHARKAPAQTPRSFHAELKDAKLGWRS
jgi:hypothetical protein